MRQLELERIRRRHARGDNVGARNATAGLDIDGVHLVHEVREGEIDSGAVAGHGVEVDVPAELPDEEPRHGEPEARPPGPRWVVGGGDNAQTVVREVSTTKITNSRRRD